MESASRTPSKDREKQSAAARSFHKNKRSSGTFRPQGASQRLGSDAEARTRRSLVTASKHIFLKRSSGHWSATVFASMSDRRVFFFFLIVFLLFSYFNRSEAQQKKKKEKDTRQLPTVGYFYGSLALKLCRAAIKDPPPTRTSFSGLWAIPGMREREGSVRRWVVFYRCAQVEVRQLTRTQRSVNHKNLSAAINKRQPEI
jgi:hypothetical protein